MSLQQAQAAMAQLIRFPDDYRGDGLAEFLSGFALNSEERQSLVGLANDPLFAKYGRIQRMVRARTLYGRIPLVSRVVPESVLDEIRLSRFEPQHAATEKKRLVPAFLRLVLSDPFARERVLRSAPPFALEVAAFELAQVELRINALAVLLEPPEGSRLAHGAFRVLRCHYAIVDFVRAKDSSPEVVERPTCLLMVRGEPRERYFEIDEATAEYLDRELKGERGELPTETRQGLERLGLLKGGRPEGLPESKN